MKRLKVNWKRLICLTIMMLIALAPAVDMLLATEAATPPAEAVVPQGKYSKEDLTKMLAPIALYPDILLAQILAGSTKPLEIVSASQFMAQEANKNLEGDALEEKIEAQSWDVNVKALCQFKETLSTMAKNIDETEKLGEAYLDQHGEVMATVQELRKKAREAGNLKSSEQMKVEEEGSEIVIVSSNPQVIYVPAYNPIYVYGPWWYPAPPYYWYPNPRPGPGIGFVIGIGVGLRWNNHHRHRHYHRRNTNVNVNVNVNRNKNTNVNVNRSVNKNTNVNVKNNTNTTGAKKAVNPSNKAVRGNDISKVSTKNTKQNSGFSQMSSGDAGRQSRERGKKSRASSTRSSTKRSSGRSGGRRRR